MSILVAQIGARRHYAVPRALHARGLLEKFVTDFSAQIAPWRWLERTVPAGMQPASLRRLLARRVPGVPAEKIRHLPAYAASGLWDRRNGGAQTDYWARRNAAFGLAVVKQGYGAADTVYAFNGAAVEIFQEAKRRGLRAVLDQTAAPWRWNTRLLQEETERWPGWEDRPAEIDLSGNLAARERREWELADRILCGSEFAAATLRDMGVPAERCAVLPYPAGIVPQSRSGQGRQNLQGHQIPKKGNALKVLFVGTLQLRKGVQYLLEAKHLLRGEPIEIRLVGPSQLSAYAMHKLRAEMEVIGPVPRPELAKHYDWADVFVLPTLSEGAANVCYEAMAAGLPVITTPHAGSPMRDGVDGLTVPIRDPEALAERISRLADAEYRRYLAANAANLLSTMNFEGYAAELLNAISRSPRRAINR